MLAQSYATGGWGPNERFLVPGSGALGDSISSTHASFETPCGAYGHFKIARYLMSVTGDSRYGDTMERVLYNTVLGSLPMKPDGTAFYYSDYNETGAKTYYDLNCSCCSGTLGQIVADYGISSYFLNQRGAVVNLYAPSRFRFRQPSGEVTLEQTTAYPLDSTTEILIKTATTQTFSISLRIPAWAGAGTTVAVNGRRVDAQKRPVSTAAASAVIHADQPGPKIDRHIYGQFSEHLGRGIYEGIWVGPQSPIPNTRGFRNDVVAALRDLHVPVLRWPGGCFADEYHWRDGIGPRAARPVTLNTNWGGVPDTNEFGTHEFLDFAAMIGTDAYINGNLGTGSAREMAEWLQYMTSDKPTSLTAERARNGHPKPWKIAYFAVGNEAWGCGGQMTPEHYADLFRQYANFLKTPAGARPTIVASGGNNDDTSWTDALVKRVHQDMRAISFHYYTLPGKAWRAKGPAIGFGEDQCISTLAHTMQIDRFIQHNTALLDLHDPAKKISFAIDEWGTRYDPEPGREEQFLYQQNTLRDAVLTAVNFNIFHRHADRVRLANIAQMVNVLQAMILTQGSHARTAAGSIAAALVNLDPRHAVAVSVRIPGAGVLHADAVVLSAAAMDARNSFENPDAIHPVPLQGALLTGDTLTLSLPAKSVVVVDMHQLALVCNPASNFRQARAK